MRFEGTSAYVATDDLKVAVNAAITLERPLLVKGEPGTGKTVLALEIAKSLGAPLHRVAHQIDHQGAAGPLRIRRGVAAARQPARRRARQGHPQLHQARQAVGRLRRGRAAGAADRRDRQGRHRVPQRPAAGTRSHGVLRLRDRRDHQGARGGRSWSSPPTTRRSCRTRSCAAASSTTSAFPIRDDAGDHRGAFSRHQAAAGGGGAASCSTRSATCRG